MCSIVGLCSACTLLFCVSGLTIQQVYPTRILTPLKYFLKFFWLYKRSLKFQCVIHFYHLNLFHFVSKKLFFIFHVRCCNMHLNKNMFTVAHNNSFVSDTVLVWLTDCRLSFLGKTQNTGTAIHDHISPAHNL